VLYIGGWGRSGSTLLDRVLGQLPGFAAVGELRELWERGVRENRPCGCGQAFHECPFWTDVGRTAFGGWGRLDLDEVLGLRYSLDRGWTAPALTGPRVPRRLEGRLRRYLEILDPLYAAIRSVSGDDVVVDSSKLPMHAALLRRIPLDVRVVHLVRDSRGVVYSWRKQVLRNRAAAESEGARYLERYDPVSASARYLVYNALTARLARRGLPLLLVRYEDFVARPAASVRTIAAFAGAIPSEQDLDCIGPDWVELRPNHTVDGNPMRFSVGTVKLVADEEWRQRMRRRDRVLVTAITGPLLRRYRYAVGSITRAPGSAARSSIRADK
jgi:hypothetical protein